MVPPRSTLALLLLASACGTPEPDPYLDAAEDAAIWLKSVAIATDTGLGWAADPEDSTTVQTNLYSGSAGVVLFFSELHRATSKERYRALAVAGAEYLAASLPDSASLSEVGLYTGVNDSSWFDEIHRSTAGLIHTGIPDSLTAGFWNNVSQCCGNAGVAEFFHALNSVTPRAEYADFGRHVTENLLARATRDDTGIRWIQAEHRVQPDLLIAQTGLMQGAAGIGWLLLKLGAPDRFQPAVLPDSPWTS